MNCDSAPLASAEGVSSSKIPAAFAKMGPQYKVASEVSGKHQNQKLDCIIERMGEDGLPLLCKRWHSTKSPKDKASLVADICRLFGSFYWAKPRSLFMFLNLTRLLKPPMHFWTWTSCTQSLTVRKMAPGLLKTPAQVSKFSKGKYLGLTKVLLGSKQVIGYAVADVMGKVVKPQLQRYKTTWGKKNPGVDPKSFRHCIYHRYLAESFSYDDLNNSKVSCVKFMFTLLPTGVKYLNTYLQSTPRLGFLYNVPESHPVLQSMAYVLESHLSRGVQVIIISLSNSTRSPFNGLPEFSLKTLTILADLSLRLRPFAGFCYANKSVWQKVIYK
jgi:hypothetical protein